MACLCLFPKYFILHNEHQEGGCYSWLDVQGRLMWSRMIVWLRYWLCVPNVHSNVKNQRQDSWGSFLLSETSPPIYFGLPAINADLSSSSILWNPWFWWSSFFIQFLCILPFRIVIGMPQTICRTLEHSSWKLRNNSLGFCSSVLRQLSVLPNCPSLFLCLLCNSVVRRCYYRQLP